MPRCTCDLNIGWTALECPKHELPSLVVLDGYTPATMRNPLGSPVFQTHTLTPKLTFALAPSAERNK